LNAARSSAENNRLFPGREVSARVDLVEVDQVAIGAPGPCLRGPIAFPRKTVIATGSAIWAVLPVEDFEELLDVFTANIGPERRELRAPRIPGGLSRERTWASLPE